MELKKITDLDESEIVQVGGGIVVEATLLGRAFYWAGVVQTGQWVIEGAYAAGKWVGENS